MFSQSPSQRPLAVPGGPEAQSRFDLLKPRVQAAFQDTDVKKLPRAELAARIGQIVADEFAGAQGGLNLLERRDLVTDLINWHLSADRAQERVPPDGSDKIVVFPKPDASSSQESRSRQVPASNGHAVEDAKRTMQPLVMERLDVTAASQLPRDALSQQIGGLVGELMEEEKLQLNGMEQQTVVELLLDDMLGLGPLEPLLADESITDIMVNGANQVYIERRGKLELTDVRFRDDDHVLTVARRIVSIIGRRVDESSPLVDARLQDGSRVNIIIPPLAIDGPAISIRKFAKKSITLDVMKRQNNVS
ncbi:MAG: CpaF family protein, partial [Proteobacteria bacterium]|nr:CpaF family protein [Pseudomonadota bacterium]